MNKLFLIIILQMFFVTNSQIKDTINISGDILLSINLNGGNKPLYGGNLKSNVSYIHNAWELSTSPSFTLNYSTNTTGNLIIQRRELYNSFVLSHKLTNNWKIIGFSEYDNSYIQKIDMRFNVGFGPGFRYVTNKAEIHISEVLLTERLNSKIEEINDYFVIRASTRIKFIYKSDFCKITSIHLIQPALYTDQNICTNKHMIYRTNSKIEFNISKKTSLGFTYDGIYQGYTSYLIGSIKPFDWNSAFFISYKI